MGLTHRYDMLPHCSVCGVPGGIPFMKGFVAPEHNQSDGQCPGSGKACTIHSVVVTEQGGSAGDRPMR